MNEAAFSAQTAKLSVAFPGKEIDRLTMQLWWGFFRCLPSEVFVAGIDKLILSHKFPTMPTTGEIAEACVGGHFQIIPSHRRRGDATPDQIMKAYQEKYEEHLLKLKAPNRALLTSSNSPPALSVADLEREINASKHRCEVLTRENFQLKEKTKTLEIQLRRVGAELAKYESRKTIA